MAKEMIAMLLAGGQGSRLYALTETLAKPAVPFGGSYRILDFVMNNFVNSGIIKIFVITQYKSQSLQYLCLPTKPLRALCGKLNRWCVCKITRNLL